MKQKLLKLLAVGLTVLPVYLLGASQMASASEWDSSYTIQVFGQPRQFTYEYGRRVYTPGTIWFIDQSWRWDGGSKDEYFGGAYNNDYREHHTGGFPEYAVDYPFMTKVRRSPGLLVSIPAGTKSISVKGSLSALRNRVPSPGDPLLGISSMGNLIQDCGVWSGQYTLTSSGKLSAEAYVGFATYCNYKIMKPMVIVEAADRSWKQITPVDVIDYNLPAAQVGTIPSEILQKNVDVSLLVPTGYSGDAHVTISGFVVSFDYVWKTTREPTVNEVRGGQRDDVRMYYRSQGVGMLPLATPGAFSIDAVQPVLSGTVESSKKLVEGFKGSIPIEFNVSTD